MDDIKALELMKEHKKTADSLTATLYGYGIKAMEEVANKKSINEQKQELYNRICSEICKHNAKANSIEANYEMINTICPKCPLYELTR